jgi:hypothetical protein
MFVCVLYAPELMELYFLQQTTSKTESIWITLDATVPGFSSKWRRIKGAGGVSRMEM